jgi:hypothetical protein
LITWILLALTQPGMIAKSGLASKVEAYLATKAGMYCDVAEKLVFNHLQKNDQVVLRYARGVA